MRRASPPATPRARRYIRTIAQDTGLLGAAALPTLLGLGTVRERRGRTVDAVEQSDAVTLDRDEVVTPYGRTENGVTQDDASDVAATVRHEPPRAEPAVSTRSRRQFRRTVSEKRRGRRADVDRSHGDATGS